MDASPPASDPPNPETAAALWGRAVEGYIEERFAQEDAPLRAIRQAMEGAGIPEIQLPAVTARTLQLLLRLMGARRILEVGTLAGYSALWMARALPERLQEGEGILTLEIDPTRAALAERLLGEAGVGDRVRIQVGDAALLLPTLGPDESFDAMLLDADKEGLPAYLGEARRLLRPGGLLLVDNALWKGRVLDPSDRDPTTEAIRLSQALIAADPSFDATLLSIGDGLLVALRR